MRVPVEHECFIPVSYHRIVKTLLRRVTDQEQRRLLKDFCRLIQSIYHFEYHRTALQLKEDFELFCPDQDRGELDHLDAVEIEQAEVRFLDHFMHVMQKGNFRLLTQQDVDVAEEEDYLFTLPVQIDWEKMDDELLPRFRRDRLAPELAAQMPRFSDRILIYKRGTGVDETVAFHFLQKLDILVSRLLVGLIRFPARLFGQRGKDFASRLETDIDGEIEPEGAEASSPASPEARASSSGAPANGSPESDGEAVASSPAADGKVREEDFEAHRCTKIHEDKFIERITLRSTLDGVSWLFRRTKIQEPTFREIIILFRPASPPPARGEPRPPKDRTIFIKAFRHIPMADLEVVFPDKKISMKPLDSIKLVVTGAMGLVVVVTKFLAQAALNPVFALAALGTIGGYAAKVFFGFKNSVDRYHHLVTDSLYHKNLDNDLGVIFYLIDSLEEQEFKEAVLAYALLLERGPLSIGDLDACCERFLLDEFGVEVDFEVHDALEKLVRENLVEREGDRYRACELPTALERLDEKWDNYFKYNSVGSV